MACTNQQHEEQDSDMRSFIESGKQWVWTKEFGIVTGSHCQIGNNFPFLHQGKIRDGKAAIDRYIVDDKKAPRTFGFIGPFIAKTIHDTTEEKVQDRWVNEVNAMKDLRHPHIVALLGTWEHLGRLSILMYPVACCDLHKFVAETDAELQKLRNQSALEGRSLSDLSPINTSDSMKEKNKLDVSKKNRKSPLELHCFQKLRMIRGFIPCLCRALSYIHRSGVRHKDIKPENILVDQSGSVIITDFGISRVFPLNQPHDTNDQPKFSYKYASPEMIERTLYRGDPSDVYSLGCVFLEMTTLLLGESLPNMVNHYVVSGNEIEQADHYHLNLDRVYSWIGHLRSPRTEPEQSRGHEEDLKVSSLSPFSMHEDQQMVDSCQHIRDMLSRDPDDRPKSKDLFQLFASVALQPCRDCDPRNPKVWEESAQQKERVVRSSEIRHSLRVTSPPGFLQDDGLDPAQATLQSSSPSHGRGSLPVRSQRSTIANTEGHYQAFEPSGLDSIPLGDTQTDMDTHRPIVSMPNGSSHGPVNRLSREADNHNVTSFSGPSPNTPFEFIRTPLQKNGLCKTGRHGIPPKLEEMIQKPDARAADPEEGPSAPDQPTLDQLRENLETTAVADMEPTKGDIEARLADVMIYNFEKKISYIAPFLTIEDLQYTTHRVPRMGNQVDIGEQGGLIELNMRFSVKAQQFFNHRYPLIFVINRPPS